MLLLQNKIPFDFKVLNFVDDPVAAGELSKLTPINKVPLLIVDEAQKIFDSRVIANFLIKTHKLRDLTLEEENMVSCAYSCLDTGVLLFLMKRDGFDMNHEGFFLRRQRARIAENLRYMEAWAKKLDPNNPGDWNYASMSLFCFLEWGEIRAGVIKLSEQPIFNSFHQKFSKAPEVEKTSFAN
jgi:glutathione S-transferase